MASEIAVALIGGGAGLATGIVGTLFAPWATWRFEERRLARQRRIERIEEWKEGVADLRDDELRHGKPFKRMRPLHEQGNIAAPPAFDTYVPSPDLIDLSTKSWWGTLKLELSDQKRRDIQELNRLALDQRMGVLPGRLAEEINLIERNVWKLLG
ncbi:hypothetical protein M2272_001224 [Mycobacterium frederiksbergense]|uniref:Uncharacterized protein n=1 Tax=Mycolicibacterium frederiksbergense TaxID=117567 RepID=A0ABT6KV54_9MYCO|nr:hypothetical protein [Mycolicibacterium frederiksbergense]MDH6194595.1 hypothetical protein [Mycolicibacterium frederiksbergense]